MHTAERPAGARSGIVGYGPGLQSFAVYLMVVHFIPAHRCVALLESLTGAAPSVGFVHGMLARVAALLDATDKRIRTLITLAHAVSCDETPLRVGPKKPKPGKKKAEKYLLVACTELYTHYLLGDRDLDTFKAFIFKDLIDSVIVHDRYQNYLRHEAPRHIPNTVGNELGGRFLGLMTNLDPKGEGNRSMSGKQRSCSGV